MKYILILIIALLYSYGGAANTSKAWRRYGVPLCVTLATMNVCGFLLVLPLIMGYGEDSFIRALLNGSNLLTRLVIGSLITFILALTTGSYLCFLFMPWYVALTTKWKWDNFLVWKFNVEELLIGGGIGLCTLL